MTQAEKAMQGNRARGMSEILFPSQCQETEQTKETDLVWVKKMGTGEKCVCLNRKGVRCFSFDGRSFRRHHQSTHSCLAL